ncbi:hypothetical protein DXG01_004029 [Tephrocybe rancida]|nr:hypothetical protein DXG01_004029 [Tephrocybe rancida]
MSTTSTPSKAGMMGTQDHTLSTVKPLLHEDLRTKYAHSIPVIDFVVSVWGIDRDLATNLLGRSWSLLEEPLQTYQSADHEKKLYAPFASIANALVKTAQDLARQILQPHASAEVADADCEENPIFFWNALGEKALTSAITSRKPDMLTVAKVHANITPRWPLVKHILEFKRRLRPKGKSRGSRRLPAHVTGESADGSSNRTMSSTGSRKRHKPAQNNDSDGSSKLPTHVTGVSADGSLYDSVPSTSGSQKRKRVQNDRATEAKRPRTTDPAVPTEMDRQHIQLGVYSLECLNASSRHYVSGLWIDQFNVSLWYYDRSCALRSKIFNFMESPAELALVLYALSACDDKHAGFDPHLSVCRSLSEPTNKKDPNWQEVVGSEFNFPASTDYPGRGNYLINETLFRYNGLIGRGTMVYAVTPQLDKPAEIEALKICWPHLTRSLEGDILQHLRDKLPAQWADHIPEVTFSATLSAEELQLPRIDLLNISRPLNFEDRQLHVLNMKLYRKLWEVGSVGEFMEIFVDCVECHYHAYSSGRVLHRDLSENNLMFKTAVNGTKQGILNDWDMASFVDENDGIQLSTATHRTGTVPFMAMDLLVDNFPPPHLYRHDLESFFYILVWSAVHHDFTNKTRLCTNPALEEWNAEKFLTAANHKNAVFTKVDNFNLVLANVLPDSMILVPWIDSLWTLFSDALQMTETVKKKKKSHPGIEFLDWDDATLGGQVTFFTFMKALGRTPRGDFSP